jgi:hypothetical protein
MSMGIVAAKAASNNSRTMIIFRAMRMKRAEILNELVTVWGSTLYMEYGGGGNIVSHSWVIFNGNEVRPSIAELENAIDRAISWVARL